MKKILISILAIILCLPTLAFVGCDKQAEPIDMSVYFKDEVKYRIYPTNTNTEKTTILSEFTDSKHDNADQYMYVTLTGNSDWIYQMTIKEVSFEIYSNQTETVEFSVSITNLENGDQSSSGGSSYFLKEIPVDLKKGKSVKVTIPVNDVVKSLSTTTTLKIATRTSDYFYVDGENTGLKFDIHSIKVYGKHK